MRITYLLPTTELGGGIKVAFEHASLLLQRRHDVTVAAPGALPAWTSYAGRYIDCNAHPVQLPPQDLVIATFWTTVARALDLGLGPVAHFCQGYEGGLEHLAGEREQIEGVYRQDLPTLVVNPTLGASLEQRFGRRWRLAPPALDACFRPMFRWRPHARPRVVLPGIFEAPVKGVGWGLEAVRLMEAAGLPCVLLRVSMLEMSTGEAAIREAEVYLRGVAPGRVAAELRQSDLLLLPSRDDEGFGLPLLEAMASKVPAVVSDIASTRFMAPQGVQRVTFGDSRQMAEHAAAILGSPRRWRAMRRRAFREAQEFAPRRVADQLELAVAWAAAYTKAGIPQKRSLSP